MRKILSTALVLGLCTSLLGCPPPADKKTTDTPPAEGTPDKPADGGEAPAETPATKPAEGGDKPAETAKSDAGVDISHVKAGQKYHYHMSQAGTEMDMVWEVKEVKEDGIVYAITTIMNGNPLGPATEQTWPMPKKPEGTPAEAPADAPKAETERTKMDHAGMSWDVMITKSGDMTTYATMSPGSDWAATFPGVLKTMQGDKVTMELTKVE